MAGNDDGTLSTWWWLRDEQGFICGIVGDDDIAEEVLRQFFEQDPANSMDRDWRALAIEANLLSGQAMCTFRDREFWRSNSDFGTRCDFIYKSSSIHWAGPIARSETSLETRDVVRQEIDPQFTAEYRLIGVKLRHEAVVDFLRSKRLQEEQPPAPDPSQQQLSEPPAPESEPLKPERETVSAPEHKRWLKSEEGIPWLTNRMKERQIPKERRKKAAWARERHEEMKQAFGPNLPWAEPDTLRRRADQILKDERLQAQQPGGQPGKKN